MDKSNELNKRLLKLKWYFIILIISSTLYLILHTVSIWTDLNHGGTLAMGLISFATMAVGVVFLILVIVESAIINKKRPEYKLNMQYIFASIIIGIIGVVILFSFIVVLTSNSKEAIKTQNQSSGVKVVSWLMIAFVYSGIVTFYALSLVKIMRIIKQKLEPVENTKVQ